jgi:hypothetical protein
MNLFLISGWVVLFFIKLEFPLQTGTAAAGENEMLRGDGIRNNQNIFRKIYNK